MFKNCYRLGVALMTLFVFGLALPSAFAQVINLPAGGGVGWGALGAALDPETDDIFVVGSGITSTGEFVTASVSYGGALNTAFGGGLVATDVSGKGWINWAYACAADSSGRVLVGGLYTTTKGTEYALVRYDTNGKLDKTFNKTGIVTTSFGDGFLTGIRDMVLQGSGSNARIVVVGGYPWDLQSPLTLARYLPTGVLDSTFGSNGTVNSNMDVVAEAVALQSDGSIIVGTRGMTLIRYTANGELDTTFGTDGVATFSVAGQSTHLNGIVVDGDDNIVIAGDLDGDVAVVRFTINGELDTTFGPVLPTGLSQGYITESFGSTATAVALQGDGAIDIAGVASNGNLLVAQFTSDGALDTTFGSTGGVFNGQGYADDFAYPPEGIGHSVLVQSNGQIVAVGQNAAGVNAAIRYNSNGTPDTSF